MKQTPWHKNQLVIAALLVLFFPLGIFLMWRYTNWNKKVKWAISGVIVLFVLVGMSQDSTKTNTETLGSSQNQQQITIVTPSPTSEPAERQDVFVTSQIVKKVDEKYRYFFDIRNKSEKNFEGSVSIMIFNSQLKNPLASETFNTRQVIEPTLGTSVYLDAHTGPVEIHGENGLSKFKYVIKVNGQEVNSGEGKITDIFESLEY